MHPVFSSVISLEFGWNKGWFSLNKPRKRSRSRKSAFDSGKIKNRSHKRDGIAVGRIRTFPFVSDSAFDSVAYDLVKTRLLESEAEADAL